MPINSIDQLKRLLAAKKSDGRVTAQDAQKLIDLVKKDGVTSSERRYLRAAAENDDSFEPGAVHQVKQFLAVEARALMVDEVQATVVAAQGRTTVAPPSVPAEDAPRLSFDWVSGDVFKDGVSAADVVQGILGDCYVLAGFAAVAAQNPERIEDAIEDHGDGTFTVHFHDFSSPDGKKDVLIDGRLPLMSGGLTYGKNKDRKELWVGLLEKAYAQWKGGYDALERGGGMLVDVMGALTGRAGDTAAIGPGDEDFTIGVIQYALKANLTVAAATKPRSHEAEYRGTGLYASHGYTVLGTSEINGEYHLTLRNPWGRGEPSGNGPEDGVFSLPLSKFLVLFQEIAIS